MYIGQFKDIDETLYTVKIYYPLENPDYYYTLYVSSYESEADEYIATDIVAKFTGNYVDFENNSDNTYTDPGQAMEFEIISSATNDGRDNLDFLYVHIGGPWDGDGTTNDYLTICHAWNYSAIYEQSHSVGNAYMTRTLIDPEIEIQLSANPIIITQDSSELFNEIKPLSATIELVTDRLYEELYANDNQSVEVLIYRENMLIFEGFLTPYIYNQPYAKQLDTIQLEAVSKLSTLKDIDYKIIGDEISIVSFSDILKHIFVEGAKYREDTFEVLYFTSYDLPFNQLKISEANFFDDDDTATPWKMEEVLSEICKYLGLSCFEWEGVIYLVDYMRVNIIQTQAFRRIRLDSLDGTFYTHLSPSKTITSDLYASNDSNISYDEIYNKVNVNANCYNIDELVTDIEDTANSTSISNYPDTMNCYTYKINWAGYVKNKTYTNTLYTMYRLLDADSNWKHRYWYMKPGGDSVTNPISVEYTNPTDPERPYYDSTSESKYDDYRGSDNVNTRCAVVCRYAVTSGDQPSIDWENVIMFNCLDDTIRTSNYSITILPYLYEDYWQVPVLEYTSPEPLRFSPNNGTSWIVINGELLYQCNTRQNDKNYSIVSSSAASTSKVIISNPMNDVYDISPYSYRIYKADKYDEITGFPKNTKDRNVARSWPNRKSSSADYGKGYPMLKCKLQIGDKYWDGSAWTTTDSTFYINFNNGASGGTEETFNCYEWQKIAPNYNYTAKLDGDGWAIPIKPGDNISGLMKFTLYTPSQLGPIGNWPGHVPWMMLFPIIYMKGFEINYVYTDDNAWYLKDDNKQDEDIVYSNTVDTNFSREYDDIELKINTYTNNVPISRSFVMYGLNNIYSTKFYNYATGKTLEMEYHIIERLLQHYIDKKLIYETSLKCYNSNNIRSICPYYRHEIEMTSVDTFRNSDGTNKHFMLDSYEFDVKNNSINTKFIEW